VTKFPTIVPLLASFLVLTAVTVLQRSSRLAAALTATMPLTIPLALWIVAAGKPDDPQAMAEFARGLLWSTWPTVLFVAEIWVGLPGRLAPGADDRRRVPCLGPGGCGDPRCEARDRWLAPWTAPRPAGVSEWAED
jgi:hypothetical protein